MTYKMVGQNQKTKRIWVNTLYILNIKGSNSDIYLKSLNYITFISWGWKLYFWKNDLLLSSPQKELFAGKLENTDGKKEKKV